MVAALDDVLRDVEKVESRPMCHGASVAIAGTAREGQMLISESEIGSMWRRERIESEPDHIHGVDVNSTN